MSEGGDKILAGLNEALQGNWSRVSVGAKDWIRADGMRHARNSRAWALGTQQGNGFHVRRVVWGRLMAREEKRPGEKIKRATILIRSE
jgi:hypothetical protein